MHNNQSSQSNEGMFQDPKDEEKLCQVLKALVEEWGPEKVIVSVPTVWKESTGNSTLGRVQLEFTEDNAVAVRVRCDEINASIDNIVQLKKR